jgi:hypothetical protein
VAEFALETILKNVKFLTKIQNKNCFNLTMFVSPRCNNIALFIFSNTLFLVIQLGMVKKILIGAAIGAAVGASVAAVKWHMKDKYEYMQKCRH